MHLNELVDIYLLLSNCLYIVCVYMYMCVYVYVCVCVYIYIYIYIYMRWMLLIHYEFVKKKYHDDFSNMDISSWIVVISSCITVVYSICAVCSYTMSAKYITAVSSYKDIV